MKKGGQQPHEPTDQGRAIVRTLSGLGVPQDDICILAGCSKPTLHKHYRDDLDRGMAEANSQIAQTLFKQAISGNIAALIFWTKSRMGWREKHEIEITHNVNVIRAPRISSSTQEWIAQHAIEHNGAIEEIN